ncbi:MAG: hypothetical protein HN730_01575 [Bdellovibrionales bacterium]|nr:hypothetical protein [Bdellovibrionales bacterium]
MRLLYSMLLLIGFTEVLYASLPAKSGRHLFTPTEVEELRYLKSSKFILQRKREVLRARSQHFLSRVLQLTLKAESKQRQGKKASNKNPWRQLEHQDWLSLQRRVMGRMLAEEEHSGE